MNAPTDLVVVEGRAIKFGTREVLCKNDGCCASITSTNRHFAVPKAGSDVGDIVVMGPHPAHHIVVAITQLNGVTDRADSYNLRTKNGKRVGSKQPHLLHLKTPQRLEEVGWAMRE